MVTECKQWKFVTLLRDCILRLLTILSYRLLYDVCCLKTRILVSESRGGIFLSSQGVNIHVRNPADPRAV